MTRTPLPARREADGFEFEHHGVSYAVSVGYLPDGNGIGELFINAGKLGSSVHILAREAAVILSIARQFGTPLATLRDALPKLKDGSPAGPIGIALKMAEES